MISSLIEQIRSDLHKHNDRFAIGIDVRNKIEDIRDFPRLLKSMQGEGIDTSVMFLQTDDNTLIKRFSETRRTHPLTSNTMTLADAIMLERKELEPVASNADLFIDTTSTNIYQLRSLIQQRLTNGNDNNIALLFQSFGFKFGVPHDADFVFDARCLPNPYWEPELRAYSGRDTPVIEYLSGIDDVKSMIDDITCFLDNWLPRFESINRKYITIAIGCTGGRHRSVYLIEELRSHYREKYRNVQTRHREMT
jgi:UPF0042 nucleotide-binding protein